MINSFRSIIGQHLQRIRQIPRNRRAVQRGTRPDTIFFQRELKGFLGCNDAWLAETAAEYRSCSVAWKHLSCLRSPSRRTDGLAKSLDVAEGFALWALVKHARPQVVVELGVRFGVSARLWKEALKRYVPNHELILCDLEDQRRFISDSECTFLPGDALGTLPEVLISHSVDLLHNDAHPYDLIHWSVTEALKHKVPILTFHDVGHKHPRGPFKAESSQLSRQEKLAKNTAWAQYGAWERHVISEVFDTQALHQDTIRGEGYHIQFFDSLFGFGVVLANSADHSDDHSDQ